MTAGACFDLHDPKILLQRVGTRTRAFRQTRRTPEPDDELRTTVQKIVDHEVRHVPTW
jgi:hypothetical protein